MTLIFIGMADPYIKSIFFISTSRDFHFMEKSLDLVFAHYAYIYNNIQFKYCFTLFFLIEKHLDPSLVLQKFINHYQFMHYFYVCYLSWNMKLFK